MSSGEKFLQMVICIALFFGVVAAILLLTSKLRSRTGERIQFLAFVLPAIALIAIGLTRFWTSRPLLALTQPPAGVALAFSLAQVSLDR